RGRKPGLLRSCCSGSGAPWPGFRPRAWLAPLPQAQAPASRAEGETSMTTLHRYLARHFLLRFLLVLLGISLAVIAFELTEALGSDEWTFETVSRYALLRLPSLMAQLLPIATLIAGLLTVGELLRHRELVAAWAAGLSQY